MTKNKKKVLYILSSLILIYFLPIFGVEKSIIKNEIVKNTREPVLGKQPIVNAFKEKKLDFVDEKNLKYYVKDNEIEILKEQKENVIVQETLHWVNPLKVKKVSEAYYDFIQSNGDARYFKPNFSELFTKKIGDKITLVIDNEEFTGYITKAEIRKPSMEDVKNGYNEIYNNFIIRPTNENCLEYDNCYIGIHISGNSRYINGEFDYSEVNGGINYEFKSKGNVGIIVPLDKFQRSLNLIFD